MNETNNSDGVNNNSVEDLILDHSGDHNDMIRENGAGASHGSNNPNENYAMCQQLANDQLAFEEHNLMEQFELDTIQNSKGRLRNTRGHLRNLGGRSRNSRTLSKGKFVCLNNCGHVYKYQGNMMRHFKHECEQETRFVCKFCEKTWKRKGDMKVHMKKFHNIANYILLDD